MGETDDQQEQRSRREQILDAAFDEFADAGYQGATIKRIAHRARLQSQALIYWYFPTKEALFQSVLDRLPIVRAILDPATLLDMPPEEALPMLARAYLATADRPGVSRILRLIVPEVIRRPEIADLVSKQVIVRILEFLKTYLTRQIDLGRLRSHDVRASARAFMGMLLPQLGGKLLLPALQQDGLTDEEHIATIITIFLRGLEPVQERESENDQ
ncbi:MAG TPA: TetR/AcrR family transcriptional regulator [Ktedonobacterales bacterium]|nr:TetR/AcrR family transcriptional regulator [Ktedonobacterales bacterium]